MMCGMHEDSQGVGWLSLGDGGQVAGEASRPEAGGKQRVACNAATISTEFSGYIHLEWESSKVAASSCRPSTGWPLQGR